MFSRIERPMDKVNKMIGFLIVVAVVIGSLSVSTIVAYGESEEPVEKESYTVNLNAKGGIVYCPTISLIPGTEYGELPEPQKNNYDFTGWYTDSGCKTKISSSDIVEKPVPENLYAGWKGQGHTVFLDSCRAVLSHTKIEVNYGDIYKNLPTPTRTKMVFMGWYTKKSGGKKIQRNSIVSLNNDIILYAKWAPILFLQKDKKWSRKWYRVKREKSTIGSAGCGPTTMAMVVASIKGNNVNPAKACKWSKKKHFKAYKSGTKDGFFKAYGKKYGIKVKKIGTYDLRYTKKSKAKKYHKQAKSAVAKGNWVIVLAGKGKWTRGSGHFILWYKTEGDYALIRDPNSTSTSRTKAKVSTLQKQTKRYWIISVPESKKLIW